MKNKTIKDIAIYLALTFGLSSIFYVLVFKATVQKNMLMALISTILLMWCPATAAIITSLARKGDLKDLGLKWGKSFYSIMGYLIPVFYGAVIYGIVWLTGLGGINKDFAAKFFTASGVIRFLTIGTILNIAFALGEEIGWRGFLVPSFLEITGFTGTVLITGLIWALWHFPIMIFGSYNTPGVPILYNMIGLTISVTGMNFALSWLRLRSDSVWPAAIFHGIHNIYIQRFFDPLTTDTGNTDFVVGEFGAAMMGMAVIVALVFWSLRRKLKCVEKCRS